MFKDIDANDIARTRYLLEKMLSNLGEIEKSYVDANEELVFNTERSGGK